MKKINFFSALLLFFVVTILNVKAQVANGSEVMIQGFNWVSSSNTTGWYNVVSGKAADLKASRFDAIWLPPPSDAASTEGYLPRQLNLLNSKYGTEAQLRSMLSTLRTNNIKTLADIVINHRVGSTNWGDFTNPTWGSWATCRGDEWVGATGNSDSGDGYSAARDLDHSNVTVRNDIITWLNFLKTVGFDGWRYDYVRGYWGGYNKIYNDATSPYFSIGELWDNLNLDNADPHRQQLTNWVNATGGTSNAFDFTTKGILQQAVQGQLWRLNNGGKAPGLIGWWPAKSVTFIENHDTGSTQNHWPFPGDKAMQGYAYILTHPGTPMVFWDHFYDWGLYAQIKALIAIRKDNGIKNTSSLVINAATANLYAATIDNQVAMKIGSDAWTPTGTGWTLKASGTGYAVWAKSTNVNNAPVASISPAGGTFTGSVSVTMSATDDDTALPTIRYTLDGTTPTTTSTLYTGAISLTSTKTVKAVAYDAAGLASAVVTNVYTITPPVTNTFTVYFNRPASWAAVTPKIHFWNAVPTGSLTATTWPGVNMTADGGTWFKYTFTNVSSTSLIFNDNSGNQTLDLSRGTNGWYQNGTWSNTDPRGTVVNAAPVLNIVPVAGTYTSAVTIQMTATDDNTASPTIRYTLDGTTPTATSTIYTAPFDITTTKTLKAIAIDGAGLASAVQTNLYTINPVTTGGYTVYFKKPATWVGVPKVHYWSSTPAGALANTVYPGVSMDSDGGDWYKYTFTGVTNINLLFNDGTGSTVNKTVDLVRGTTGWYQGTTWSNTDPRTAVTGNLVIHFKKPTTWASANMYFWNVNGGTASTTWPGVVMTAEANGWYVATITGATCASLIFSNNGASQTADLSRCSEGWYNNGTWGNAAFREEDSETTSPESSELFNYPNPLESITTFDFTLEKESKVTLNVYDLRGSRVAQVIDQTLYAGKHAIMHDFSDLATGLYIYRLSVNDKITTRKMIVSK